MTPDYATRKIAVRAWNFVGYLNELFPYGELEGDEALAMDLRGIVSTGDWDALVARIPDVVEFITDHVFGGLGERINPDMLTLMVEFVIEMEALMQGNELEAVLAAARQVVDAGPNVRELSTRALANALTNHEAATKRRATRTRYRIVDSTEEVEMVGVAESTDPSIGVPSVVVYRDSDGMFVRGVESWNSTFYRVEPDGVSRGEKVIRTPVRFVRFDGTKESADVVEDWLESQAGEYRYDVAREETDVMLSYPAKRTYKLTISDLDRDEVSVVLKRGDYVVLDGEEFRFVDEMDFGDEGYQAR